jgi:hypothetical protein
MKIDSPLEGSSGENATSARSSSSDEREDEECKLGIEDNEDIFGVSPVSESAGAEMDKRMGESMDDEDGAAQIQQEDRTTMR